MSCQQPFRDDSAQILLFKIASCLAEGGSIAGVAQFNGRTGNVTLEAADVIAALGCTPACEADTISQADGDSRYVLKSGDTMTGALTIGNGVLVANDPVLELSQTWNNAAVDFKALTLNVTNTAAASGSMLIDIQQDAITRFTIFENGSLVRFLSQEQTDTGLGFFLRKRGSAVSDTAAIASGGGLATVFFSGWNGAAQVQAAAVRVLANEVFTGIANGTRLEIMATPIGSTTNTVIATFSGQGSLQLQDGTAALPALTFQSDPDTGIYRIGANVLGTSVGGVRITSVNSVGLGIGTDAATFRLSLVGTSSVADRKIGINGTQVVYLPDQTPFNGSVFFGDGGNSLSNAVSNNGRFNTGVGIAALFNNTTGENNTSIGYGSLFLNTTGARNMAVGTTALFVNTSGNNNSAIGYQTLFANTTGNNNTAVGFTALAGNSTGSGNTAVGYQALLNLTTPATGQNTAIGFNTGLGITTGNNNTIIGANVTGLAAALSNNIILADGAGVIRLQIDSSGNTTLAGTVATAAGTAALPAHTFSADLDTGMYRVGANHLGVSANGAVVLGVGAAALGFFAAVSAAPVAQQVSGANLTNNVTAGGVNDTIADYADLTIYANDAAAIRNDIYQLSRKLKQVNDALRAYGLLT